MYVSCQSHVLHVGIISPISIHMNSEITDVIHNADNSYFAVAMNVRLTEEQKIKILNGEDLYRIMQQVLLREKKIDRNKEHFWVVCLAQNNRILMIELISLGTVNKTLVEPMEVFSFALQKRAVKLIMVHNHPSGEAVHSPADYAITEQMVSIGKFLQLPVIDHLIITETEYLSFAESGLLAKIVQANRYDLTFSGVQAMQIQIKDMQRMQKLQMTKAKKEIAKGLLEKGVDVNIIVQTTGLTLKQVEGLRK